MIFLVSHHDKIFQYSKSFVTDKNEEKREMYKRKIKEYFNEANIIIHKFIEDPFFQTEYAKNLIIDIYSSYSNILISIASARFFFRKSRKIPCLIQVSTANSTASDNG